MSTLIERINEVEDSLEDIKANATTHTAAHQVVALTEQVTLLTGILLDMAKERDNKSVPAPMNTKAAKTTRAATKEESKPGATGAKTDAVEPEPDDAI